MKKKKILSQNVTLVILAASVLIGIVAIFSLIQGIACDFFPIRNIPRCNISGRLQTPLQTDIDTTISLLLQLPNEITYEGKEGVNALTLLRGKATVEDEHGFVTSINGRKADESHEFWAFYVNGKQAEVGAGEYVTSDTDVIEWKIETY